MKTSLTLLWHAIVIQILFSLLAMLMLKNTALMSDPQLAPLRVSLLFSVLGVVLSGLQLLMKRSPLFYIALGAAAYVVAQLSTFGTWVMVKAIAPLSALTLFIFVLTPWLKSRHGSA